MHESSQFENVEWEVLRFVAYEARKHREEVEYEVAFEVVPGCLPKRLVIAIDLKKWEAGVDYEENIVHQLKNYHFLIVLWENQSKHKT